MEIKWSKQAIKAKLESCNDWLIRGLMAIYNRQSPTEKEYGSTSEDNGVGFNSCDAEILTSFADQYKRLKFLSPKQIQIARKRMLKYSNQLAKIANGEI